MKQYNIPVITLALKRIRAVEGFQDVPSVKIKTTNPKSKRRFGRYYRKTSTIEMHPNNHETRLDYIDTLLHELAHHVVAYIDSLHPNSPQHQAHGTKWRQVAKYLGANDRATQYESKTKIPNYLKGVL